MAEEIGSVDAGNPGSEVTDAVVTSSPLDSFEDTDLRDYAQGKGFDKAGFEGVVKSYNYLEKMMSADKAGRTITLLGDDSTPEQKAEFFGKLGRPDAADGYTFELPEGADTSRLDALRTTAHDLGLSDAQFNGLATADAAFMENMSAENETNIGIASQEAEATLKKEWGAAYESKVKGIDAAASSLNIGEDQLDGLHKAMGPVGAMKFVDSLASQLRDDSMDLGTSQLSGLKTPDMAKQELGELQMNKEFMDAWLDRQHPGHGAAVAKKANLAKMMVGMTP
tara:strand:- start:2041 stop:2883 length:843 start_codon:yes stop_codon:yes gene_type:complete